MQLTQEQYDNYVKELEGAIAMEKARSGDLAQANVSQMSLFNSNNDQNLIQWQLDLKEDLDRIYHLLQGHMIAEDDDEDVVYREPDDPNLKPFNEFGVQLLMNVMSFYLNRNTILSNYSDETINWKVYDLGNELSDLIFNRYDEMMITIDDLDEEKVKEHLQNKIKLYPMIIKELVDTVHSAYLRAYNGGERESLRTARTVTQTEPLANFGQQQPSMYASQKKFSMLKPWTWG